MQISRKIFTYPVLCNDKLVSGYKNKNITLVFEPEDDDNFYYLKNLHYETDSKLIQQFIDENCASIKCLIECGDSIFKEVYDITPEGKDISIKKDNLRGRFEISLIGCANKNFTLPSCDEYDDDYVGYKFPVDSAQILAFDNGVSQMAYHQDDSDNLSSSIFSVTFVEGTNFKDFKVEPKMNKIEITMSSEVFNKYKQVYGINDFAEEYFCSLLIPALTESFYKCRGLITKETEDLDEICSTYNWFLSVLDAYKRLNGEELTLEKFQNISLVELAQDLLGSPLGKALDIIKAKTLSEDEEDGQN